MFTATQLKSLDRTYFHICQSTAFCIVLRSKCTGHYWKITGAGYGTAVLLDHKHAFSDPWHPQAFRGCRHDLAGAVQAIREHDEYVRSTCSLLSFERG